MEGEGVMMDVRTVDPVAGKFDLDCQSMFTERWWDVRSGCPNRRDWCLLARHLVHLYRMESFVPSVDKSASPAISGPLETIVVVDQSAVHPFSQRC